MTEQTVVPLVAFLKAVEKEIGQSKSFGAIEHEYAELIADGYRQGLRKAHDIAKSLREVVALNA